MELTMSSAIWQVMVDISIMGALLLIGEFLRAKVKLIQKVLIPPAVIAGFLALLFGDVYKRQAYGPWPVLPGPEPPAQGGEASGIGLPGYDVQYKRER